VQTYERDRRFLVPLYAAWLADFLLYFYAMARVYMGMFPDTQSFEFLLFCICIANAGALNLPIGHELAHRREFVHKFLGNLVYSKMLYSHFFIQHIKSHHKKVATIEDPSSARKGESVFYFYLRTIPQGFVETWTLESERLVRESKSPYHIVENRFIFWNILHVAYCGLIYYFLGQKVLVFQLVYSALVIMFFEAINYIEHYGLERKKD
jgi:alkane 1-monooxygenase